MRWPRKSTTELKMNKEQRFIKLQYAECVIYIFSALMALIGFYFGLIKIMDELNDIREGIIQCSITSVACIVLIVLAVKTIRCTRKYKNKIP
jgi:hypothetical protein